jgi:uncharacterized surface protein with fasciclin (FAS1) repeats
MNKILQLFLSSLLLLCAVSGCRKNAYDAFYGRPDSLAAPIYPRLQEKGNFTHLLALIDKAGYKTILSGQGYWTMFAPDDAAFVKYFQEKGIKGVSDIDSTTAQGMVQYALVYNAFKTDRIGDYQSSRGWVPNTAFKRRTAYYDFVYDETYNGQKLKVIAANRNGAYVAADNNNKYIPYFISNFVSSAGLGAGDYNYFYPSAVYSGFNVGDANVITKDIIAENGIIHETDKVITPLKNIDQYLAFKPEYSEFKRILDRFMVSYVSDADATHRYQVLSGAGDAVYVKLYSKALAFSPNNENYLRQEDNDGQANSWTLFVPTNEVLLDYEQKVLLEYYPGKTLDQLPISIINDFINGHMWARAVWPSKFSSTLNAFAEGAKQDPLTNVTDKQLLSNGLFYGTNKVQETNVFHAVYGKAYLNPAYSLFTRALDMELRSSVINTNLKYVLLLLSDKVLQSMGYDWNTAYTTFQYTAPGGSVTIGGDAVTRLKRILNLHTVLLSGNELYDLSGKGIVETLGGEYVRYDNNKVYSAGTTDQTATDKQYALVDSAKTANNGKVYYLNNGLLFSDLRAGKHIEKQVTTTTASFYSFYQFLKNSTQYNAATGEITGMQSGAFYTILIPDNAAIQDAVNEGWLPGTGTGAVKTPNYTPTNNADIELVTRFIQYHILDKNTVVPDGQKEGYYATLLKDGNGEATSVRITNQVNNMQLTDAQHTTPNAAVVIDNSNVLSDRTVIHQINHYLKYNY